MKDPEICQIPPLCVSWKCGVDIVEFLGSLLYVNHINWQLTRRKTGTVGDTWFLFSILFGSSYTVVTAARKQVQV